MLAAHERLEKHVAAVFKLSEGGMPGGAQSLTEIDKMLGEVRPESARLRALLDEGKIVSRQRDVPKPPADVDPKISHHSDRGRVHFMRSR